MFSFPRLRKKINPEMAYGAGLNGAIVNRQFPFGSPQFPAIKGNPVYHYHEGDIFTPGAENWVLEPLFELPVIAFWGSGFANTQPPNPLQPPPYEANANLVITGLGGQIPGQFATQGLVENGNVF